MIQIGVRGVEGSQQWEVNFTGDDRQWDRLGLEAWKGRGLRRAEISGGNLR